MLEYLTCVWEWLGRNAPNIIATVSLVVAGGTARFTWKQADIARQHNLRSLKPILMFDHDETHEPIPDGNMRISRRTYVRNIGIGPAIIKGVRLVVSKKSIDVSSVDAIAIALIAAAAHPNFRVTGMYTFRGPQLGLYSGKEIRLSEVEIDGVTNEVARGILERVDVATALEITYEDVYEKSTTVVSERTIYLVPS